MSRATAFLLLLALCLAPTPCPATPIAAAPEVDEFYAEGLRLYGRGEMESATELLEAAVKRFPQAGRLHFLLALTYRDSMPSQPDQAAAELYLALQLEPELPDAARSLADVLVQAGRGEEARQMLHKRVLVQPQDAGALWKLGLLLLTDQRWDEGISLLQRAVEAAPDDYRAWLALGRSYVRAGKMADALRPLERARSLAPSSPTVRYNLSLAYGAAGQDAAALKEMDVYQELQETRVHRIQELGREERLHRAMTLTEEKLSKQPGGPVTRYGDLALLYREGNSMDRGRKFLAGLAAANPEVPEPIIGQALLEHAAGRDDMALESLGQVLSRRPTYAPALGLLPELSAAQGRDRRIAALLLAADNREDTPAQLAFWRGLAAVRSNRPQEAEAQLRRALERAPADADVLLNLGVLYGQTGRLEKARSTFQALVSETPDDGEAWFNLALTEAQLNLPGPALEHLEKARAAGEQRPPVLNLLAQLLLRQGDRQRARELLQQSLATEPDQPAVRQALQAIEEEARP